LNLVIISAKRLMKRKRFCKELPTDTVRDEYDRLSNPVKLWIESNLVEDGDLTLEIDPGYRDYVEFCKSRRITPRNKDWVGRELGNLGFVTEQRLTGKHKKRVWIGLGTRKGSFSGTITEDPNTLVQGEDGLRVPKEGIT
jgi:hypothetical protein